MPVNYKNVDMISTWSKILLQYDDKNIDYRVSMVPPVCIVYDTIPHQYLLKVVTENTFTVFFITKYIRVSA